jgi:thermostable 8-oxoguanine DNA glycosylase
MNAEQPGCLLNAETILSLLQEPLILKGRPVRYRFAKQKSNYLARSMLQLRHLDHTAPDRDLRDALTTLPGVGLKTASWVVRNWRGSDYVSILDIHILRAGRILQIFHEDWSVEQNYRQLENAFLQFAKAISVKASILDSVMWMNMRQLPAAILRRLMDSDAPLPEIPRRQVSQMELTF